MTVDIARAAVIAGDGVVARYPGVLCVARSPDRDALARLLDVCAGAAGPDPGRVLARRLAQWMGGPDAPGDDLEFGTVATTGDQLGVFLVGSAAVLVPGSPFALSGADAATWTDRLIPQPEVPVVLALDGLAPPAGIAHVINDLRAGVVPGVGVVLFPVGRPAPLRPEPGGGAALDGPTVRAPAHTPRGAAPNDVHRGGALPNGSSRLLSNGALTIGSDGDAADGPRGRRQGARAADARTPNGYEWFADWSERGVPDGAEATWPWADQPADPGPDGYADPQRHANGPNPAGGPKPAGAPNPAGPPGPDDAQVPPARELAESQVHAEPPARGPSTDEPHTDRRNGHSWATEAPTPAGGSAPAQTDAPVWIDPADAAARTERNGGDRNGGDRNGGDRNGGDRNGGDRADPPGVGTAGGDPRIEGRHAILGASGAPDLGPPNDAPDAPDDAIETYDADQVHPLAADPTPDVVAVEPTGPHVEPVVPATPDDDATPIAAAVVREPVPLEDEPAPADPVAIVAPHPAPRVPTPAPRPPEQEVVAEPEPGEPRVRGRLCDDGHLNDPRSSSCLTCGAPIEDGEGTVGTRPPLGRIVFDDGATFTVDAEYLVGRMPEADPRARSGELQPIVVEDRSGSVSRVHAEILINGWDVVLVDSGSRNGTFVAGPDEDGWTPLAPGRTSLLLPGTRVRMGGRTFVFEPPVPVG